MGWMTALSGDERHELREAVGPVFVEAGSRRDVIWGGLVDLGLARELQSPNPSSTNVYKLTALGADGRRRVR